MRFLTHYNLVQGIVPGFKRQAGITSVWQIGYPRIARVMPIIFPYNKNSLDLATRAVAYAQLVTGTSFAETSQNVARTIYRAVRPSEKLEGHYSKTREQVIYHECTQVAELATFLFLRRCRKKNQLQSGDSSTILYINSESIHVRRSNPPQTK